MVRQFYRFAVVAAALQVVGCAVVQPESSCCCVDPCIVDGGTCLADGSTTGNESIDDVYCRQCGRGFAGVPLVHRLGLGHLHALFHGAHHEAVPTPVEPGPTPAIWSRFHPVPTRPVFEPSPFLSVPVYSEPIPSAPKL